MRKTIIILSSCVALLLLGYVSYRGYQVWKQRHGISMAKAYWAKGDVRNAALALQQVVQTNPRNLEGSRMMAQMLEAEHSPNTLPTALLWRQHVLELDPVSNEDRFALAQTAIMAKDYTAATNALAGVDEAGKNTATYHNIAAMAAIVGGKPAEAEAHFTESLRLDPSDQVPQMNLAVIRLHYTNDLDKAEARIALQRIIASSTNANLRIQAYRELIEDSLRCTNSSTALELSKESVQQTNSVLMDRILRLDVLMVTKNADFKPALASYRADVADKPVEVAELAAWQMTHLPLTNTLVWLRALPLLTRTNQIVEETTATCLLAMRDWQGLQTAIQHQKWDDADSNQEYLRHAYMACSLRGQGLTGAANAEWAVAVKSVNDEKYLNLQKRNFRALFELAVKLNLRDEAEQILWTMINQFPDERWAFPVLRDALIIQGRTQSLLQLFQTMHKRMPDDLSIKNDLAATAMLVGDQTSKPYELALDVYQKNSKSPDFGSTYAFALYKQGKYGDALKVMQQFSPTALQEPSIAGYYGVILKATGNKADAKNYLKLASKGHLLPEERVLFDKELAGL